MLVAMTSQTQTMWRKYYWKFLSLCLLSGRGHVEDIL